MNINRNISKTYLLTNRKLTGVAVMGVLLGMSIYIFMNSLLVGFDKSSANSVFKNTAHIKLYKDDEYAKPLLQDEKLEVLISNPKVVPHSNTLINPNQIIQTIQQLPEVTVVTPQVVSSVFYSVGKTQLAGNVYGVRATEANKMFDINSFMVEGEFDKLQNNPNGIIIGSGIAEKINLKIGDNISMVSSKAISKTLSVIGIFKSNNSAIDNTKSYINISTAQQLLREGNSYITEILINVKKYNDAEKTASTISQLTSYKAEGWKQSNETLMAANKMRKIIITFVSTTLLLVAGFGIYNILNMTVSQKINDIAILKAMGFKGKDVVKIFVVQALSIGIIGVIGGMLMATVLITILKKVYVGGDIGYFPIDYEPLKYLQGVVIGLIITFFAGYLPARKAAKVDPVEIFRK